MAFRVAAHAAATATATATGEIAVQVEVWGKVISKQLQAQAVSVASAAGHGVGLAMPAVRVNELAFQDVLCKFGLPVPQTIVAEMETWRLVLQGVRQSQLQSPLQLQQHTLPIDALQTRRLDLPQLRQPQLCLQIGLQYSLLQGAEAVAAQPVTGPCVPVFLRVRWGGLHRLANPGRMPACMKTDRSCATSLALHLEQACLMCELCCARVAAAIYF